MYASSNIGVGRGFLTVTPHNTNALPSAVRLLYVGGGGDVTATGADGSTALFKNVPDGAYLYGEFRRIAATGTTATHLVGYV